MFEVTVYGIKNDITAKPTIATTCMERPPVCKETLFDSLESGFSLKLVLKDPVHKDHLSIKTTFFIVLEYGFSLKPVLKEPVETTCL